MLSGIYKITNLENGKIYVGSSVNTKRRKSKHFSNLKNKNHHNLHLQNAYDKYGEENFKGENNPSSKLTRKQIIEVLDYFYNKNYTCANIVKLKKYSYTNVDRIIKGKTWKEIYKKFIKENLK